MSNLDNKILTFYVEENVQGAAGTYVINTDIRQQELTIKMMKVKFSDSASMIEADLMFVEFDFCGAGLFAQDGARGKIPIPLDTRANQYWNGTISVDVEASTLIFTDLKITMNRDIQQNFKYRILDNHGLSANITNWLSVTMVIEYTL